MGSLKRAKSSMGSAGAKATTSTSWLDLEAPNAVKQAKSQPVGGGWTNPFEKYDPPNEFIFPIKFGVKIKKYLKPPPGKSQPLSRHVISATVSKGSLCNLGVLEMWVLHETRWWIPFQQRTAQGTQSTGNNDLISTTVYNICFYLSVCMCVFM